MKNTKLVVLCIVVYSVFNTSAFSCPDGTVKVTVENTSPNELLLETEDEATCKLLDKARVRPNSNGKFCMKTAYLLNITTLSLNGDTPLAVTTIDLRRNVIITTPTGKSPDIDFIHVLDSQNEDTEQK